MTTAPEHQASPQETADFRGTRDPAAFQPLRLRSAITKQPTQSQERPAHRKIETLVLVIFWLLLMEGAIRKWVAPQYAQYLFFVRDPFLLLVYRRDMGGGQRVLMKDLSAPITVQGRHWGGLRLAYSF